MFIRKIPFCLAVTLFFLHLFCIWKFAVDIPFMDEWSMLNFDAFPNLSLSWLYNRHNEHRIATTRFLGWVLYQINGWNIVTHQVVNFVIYGLLLLMVYRVSRVLAPKLENWIVAGFMIFLLSTIGHENHSWAFQSSFHFGLLFSFGATFLILFRTQGAATTVLGLLMSVAAIFSFASGFVSAVMLLMVFWIFKLYRIRRLTNGDRSGEIPALIGVTCVIGASLYFWWTGYQQPAHHPPLSFPHQSAFWSCFLDLVSSGFGFSTRSRVLGLLCLCIVLFPVFADIRSRRWTLSQESVVVYAMILEILASLAVISIARAGFGQYSGKQSRYAEISAMLIPFSVLSWAIFLEEKIKRRNQVFTAIWLFCFFGFINDWKYIGVYKSHLWDRLEGVKCVEKFYRKGGDGNCPTLYPVPIGAWLVRAQELKVSFYRTMER